MFVYFDVDRTLLDFESAADVGIKTVFDLYRSEIIMDYDEFSAAWKKWAQVYFDEYSDGKLTFDEQRKKRVWKSFELNGVVLSKEENDKRFDIYWAAYEKEIKLFPDVIPTLDALKNAGIPMGVITNGDPENQKWKMELKNLTPYFTVQIISGEVGISKPDLRIFEIAQNRACELLVGLGKLEDGDSLKPSEILYIGDSIKHDIEPSVKMGWKSVFINHTGKKYDVPAGAVEVDDMKKILSMI